MTRLDRDPGPLRAYELVMAFAARRGEAALRLAMHAALPQVLRPELLHLIRLNFLPESTYDLAIEADVLFAPFCEDIGNGYYCFAVNARLQLLQGLDPAYRDESMPRSVQVARFMLDYLDHEERDVRTGSDRLRSDWIEVERWSALAFAEPALAAGQLAAALARATANDDVAARVRVSGLASTLATPLARFGELLTYAEGVEAQQMGRADDAHRLFDTLPDREIEIAGVRLKSPRRVLVESAGKETTGDLATEPAEQSGATDEGSGKHVNIIGNSPSMRSVVETAKRAAESTVPTLLLGESGTGKKLLARSIHQWSHRAAMPFIVINCAALPEELLENELFGHEQGAFTGVDQQKKGKLEIADGGTVFLDEIGDVSLPLQAKLLRVLQDREFHRMGGSEPVSANIRIIAATNKDLQQAMRAGQFREDLYFRLNVVSLTLPPLRERSADIPSLAQFFLDRHARDANRPGMTLSAAALETLTRYPWPGNIRELENVVRRAVVLSPESTIEPEVLGLLNLAETEEQSIEQTTPIRDQIYIRYSSRDQMWCELLMTHLKPAMTELGLSVWLEDRDQLRAGEDWNLQIHAAIERACLAIVLVSAGYLASDYQMEGELKRLAELARSGDLLLTWVYVRPCDYSSSRIREFRALHDLRSPLSALSNKRRDRALVEIVGKVKELIHTNLSKKQETPRREPGPSKRSGIFISYRRHDSAVVTGRIHDRLVQQFGRQAVSLDVDRPLGVDLRKHMDEQVARCDVFLAVIGPHWLKTKGRKGKSRLEEPGDFVRIEIESALKRQIPVIPLLVQGAKVPEAKRLPASIQELSHRQGIEIRPGAEFHRDMDRLIEHLKPQTRGLNGTGSMALYAFDATWNEDETEEAKETNVLKFCKCLPLDMNVFYLEGVGTRLGFIGKLLGGLAGVGGPFRIARAMEHLNQHVSEGVRTVGIIGFGRGAALALHFANQVQEEKPGVNVRFLGLWDTVASFGLPGNDLNIGWNLTLPDNVRHCYHAMALDERRGNFTLTRVAPRKGGGLGDRLQEVWFRGVHLDVGGGQSPGLSNIALCWMLRRAKQAGFPVIEAKLQEYEALCDPDAQISKNFDPKKDSQRTINPGDLVHESVKARALSGGRVHTDPPPGVRIAHG